MALTSEVHELLLSRTQNSLQACQYTLATIEAMPNKKKQFRCACILSENDIEEHDIMFGMHVTPYSFLLITILSTAFRISMFALDHLVETFHDGLSALSIDWLVERKQVGERVTPTWAR